MTISEFAKVHRLKLAKDDCGDPVIFGRIGSSNIYEYDVDALGVMFISDVLRTGLWNKFKAACLTAGMTLKQAGDAEGSFTFSPGNKQQAKLAIKGIRARAKRQVSPEQAAAGAARLLVARQAQMLSQKPQQEVIS
jgi:hypothetical protein